MTTVDTEEYWALRSDDELAEAVEEQFTSYTMSLEKTGRLRKLRKAVRQYYGRDGTGGYATSSDVTFGGDQGELSLMNVNHFRSLCKSVISLTTASRPAFQATAAQNSSEAYAQTKLAEQIWDYELDRNLDKRWVETVESMVVAQEGIIYLGWDAEGGEVVGAVPALDENGEPMVAEDGHQITVPIYEGDIECEVFGPWDCARPLWAKTFDDCDYVILRRTVNKWQLAAVFPEYRDEILAAHGPSTDAYTVTGGNYMLAGESDEIYQLELFHKRNSAVPMGRYALVVNGELLQEGPLPYHKLPVYISTADPVIGRAEGDSSTFDLLGLQDSISAVYSNMVTTQDVGGLPNFLAAKSQKLDASDLSGGLRLVEYDADGQSPPPGLMRMPKVEASDIKFAELIQAQMQILSGVNSVVRGDPEASLKSGAALALVQSMAVQANSRLQRASADVLAWMANQTLAVYQTFPQTPRIVEIVGQGSGSTVNQFKADDIRDVRRIRAELVNPLQRTIAGKKELADTIMQQFPDAFTAQSYLTFIESGRLDPLFNGPFSEGMGIKAENEMLQQGQDVVALITDNHAEHIQEHKALLDGRSRLALDAEKIQRITAHIMAHVQLWQQLTEQSPALLAATGQQPAPMPAPPMPMGGPPPPGGPPTGGGAMFDPNAPVPPVTPPGMPQVLQGAPMGTDVNPGAAEPVRLPEMPKNPLTGQRVNVPGVMT